MIDFWSKQLKEEVRTGRLFVHAPSYILLKTELLGTTCSCGNGVDEGSEEAARQSVPPEGVRTEATVLFPLAPLSEMGPA